jgi:hypothetical protein
MVFENRLFKYEGKWMMRDPIVTRISSSKSPYRHQTNPIVEPLDDGISIDKTLMSFSTVANIKDCFEYRPLIQVGRFTEFDLVATYYTQHKTEKVKYHVIYYPTFQFYPWKRSKTVISRKVLGCIFTEENKARFPEIYNQALEKVRKSREIRSTINFYI